MVTSTRIDLANKLRDELPSSWLVLPYGTELENPMAPVVAVRQMSVARTPGAPRTLRDTTFTVALVEPGLDPELVETALDDDIERLLDTLELVAIDGLIWTGAERVTFENRFHGYEVTVQVTDERVGT